MVGGAVPDESGRHLVLSLARLNRIRDCDPVDMTMTAEAGVVLKTAQNAAQEAGCLFPLSLGAEGTATIGGVLSTNAGGNTTVRYGNARELMLGLEVVLPDGQIWNGLRRLRKDNTGYALRHLFVGAEGTLGIVTAAATPPLPCAPWRMRKRRSACSAASGTGTTARCAPSNTCPAPVSISA
jgi:FAD/FMN-containing dehydrogenase